MAICIEFIFLFFMFRSIFCGIVNIFRIFYLVLSVFYALGDHLTKLWCFSLVLTFFLSSLLLISI